MKQRVRGRWAVVLPAAAEGTATAVVLGYGPLYIRQVLGEPRLTVATLMLAVSALTWFLAATVWGRQGDRVSRPLTLVGWVLILSGVVQAVLPVAATSAAFIIIVGVWACLLAAIAPLSVSWLTLQNPEHPAEESAGFYRMRSVGWTIGSMGASGLVRVMDLDGIAAGFWLGSVLSLMVGLVVLGALRAVEPVDRRARMGVDQGNAEPEGGPTGEPVYRQGGQPADRRATERADQGTAEPADQWATEPADRRAGTSGPGESHVGPGRGPAPSGGQPVPPVSGPIWRFHAVATLAGVILLTVTGNEAFFAVIGPYLTEYLTGSLEHVGLSLGVASLLGIGLARPLGRLADRWGAERVFIAGCLLYVAMYALMVLWRQPLATVALFAVPVFPFMSAGATGTLSRRTPAARRAEAIGVYEGTSSLAAAAGSVLGGAVADAVGLGWVPVMSLGLAVGGLVLAWLRLRPGPMPQSPGQESVFPLTNIE